MGLDGGQWINNKCGYGRQIPHNHIGLGDERERHKRRYGAIQEKNIPF